MKKFDFNLEIPLNTVSFGFVAQNICRNLWQRGLEPCIHLIHNNCDLSAYKIDADFTKWFESCIKKAKAKYSKLQPSFRLWHVVESENSVSCKTVLNTYFELNSLTPTEINVLSNQSSILLTSKYSIDVFNKFGINHTNFMPLAFDRVHFFDTKKKYLGPDIITHGLFGKLEPLRKRHKKIIQLWLKKYGGNRRYALHLCLHNPHLTPEQHNALLGDIFENKKPPFIVNLLGFCNTLAALNDAWNSVNIVTDCGTESWSLPSFHTVALGKYGVIGNYGGLQSWTNERNSILIPPTEKMISAEDGVFFKRGGEYNDGEIFDFNEEDLLKGWEEAEKRYLANKVNTEGLKLQTDFPWTKTVDIILDELQKLV